ncbi:acetoin utilization deacetylase AcuC-like enzyme [Angulomicrobium tetraedrale]|uniref:Acetoin utilization deacetylase AcuC-like enzyme n=1 Tax=Ancylobacter tetraedralis TaxID=217068 RepID=A0A839ZE31_9HYPH|nr:histone deacetylase family protein [Ancylobacter tetraedralis]MBB3772968.1 acetoin utilization deacetylase AcuC-like enzyme [Ancylobacter tetraedralis]
MKIIHTPRHLGHSGHVELNNGQIVPAFEKPERVAMILDAIGARGLGPLIEPTVHGLDPLLAVHDPAYVRFLAQAWELWTAEGRETPALPSFWRAPGMRFIEPDAIDGKLGHFSFDAGCCIVAGTWDAVQAGADAALTGVDLLSGGERAAFALCRPPGHHAHAGTMGGYCFINNAAVAAQSLRDRGAARVAILDVDYHHGNGTQAIFYERGDVLVCNIHADPRQEFPYFLGYADETGAGAGEGFNANFPLPWGTDYEGWSAALEAACGRVNAFAPDALIVSLGVDTYKHDPISQFRLDSPDYLRIGRRIAALGLPTLFVMEGGYAVEAIGVNVANTLEGFETA